MHQRNKTARYKVGNYVPYFMCGLSTWFSSGPNKQRAVLEFIMNILKGKPIKLVPLCHRLSTLNQFTFTHTHMDSTRFLVLSMKDCPYFINTTKLSLLIIIDILHELKVKENTQYISSTENCFHLILKIDWLPLINLRLL